jgi:hypothetical protein
MNFVRRTENNDSHLNSLGFALYAPEGGHNDEARYGNVEWNVNSDDLNVLTINEGNLEEIVEAMLAGDNCTDYNLNGEDALNILSGADNNDIVDNAGIWDDPSDGLWANMVAYLIDNGYDGMFYADGLVLVK